MSGYSREQILDAVRGVFSTHLSVTNLEETTHLFRELQLDSLQQLTLVVEIENQFKICFEPEDEANLETVADVIDCIILRLDRGAPSEDIEPSELVDRD